MIGRLGWLAALLVLVKGQSDQEILDATLAVWDAGAANFFSDTELQYNPDGPILFTFVDETRFTGTYARLLDMMDNYIEDTGSGREESCDATCEAERDSFLDDILATQSMDEARQFIGSYDANLLDPATFKSYMYDIWFNYYTRSGGPLDSSGFEHVILGEIDSGELKGYHGWEKTYFDEQAGDFVYGNSQGVCDPDIPKFDMTYKGLDKPITSIFLKTPPEVEFAIYTICFNMRPNSACDANLGGSIQPIQTYTNDCSNGFGGSCVGTAYPIC